MIKAEIDILKNLNHPNILRLYEIYETPSKIILVTEMCDGIELFDEIMEREKFGEADAANVIKQLLQAISYCHSKQIAHRDLKPENILFDSKSKGDIKLLDFGCGQHFGSDASGKMHTMIGSAYYIAPEVLDGSYTEKCDLWSVGVLVYILLSGCPPFDGNDEEIYAKVRIGTYKLTGKVWEMVSD